MDRREFLKISALAAGATLLPSFAFAGSQWVDTWWEEQEEQAPDELVPATAGKIDKFCPGLLRLKSGIHGEAYEFRYRDGAGNYNPDVVAALDWFLRCRDGTWQRMDMRAIETLNYLSALLEVPVIQINSAYRSPDYNAKLVRRGEGAARDSLHQYGQALDYFIPGISIKEVCSYTLYARNLMGYGGVGYYPRSGFVHLDAGPRKEWARG